MQTRDPAAPGQVPLDSAVKPPPELSMVLARTFVLVGTQDTFLDVIGEESHLTLSPETKPPCSLLVPA